MQTLGITRRNFVAGASMATVTAAVSAAAFASAAHAEEAPAWDYEADIVVIGAGGGGLMAACRAAEEGAKVIVLEKGPMVGGDTILSSQCAQGFWVGRVAEGDTPETYLEDMKAAHWATEKGMAGEPLPDEFPLTRAWLDGCSPMYEFAEKMGVQWADVTTVHQSWYPQPQWDTMPTRQWAPANGPLTVTLESAAIGLGVRIEVSTPAIGLVSDADGRVAGVRALDPGDNEVTYRAAKGVILACGGFNANRAMMKRYLPEQGSGYCGGCDYNTGDGIEMVRALGGKLTDLSLGTHWMVYDDASYTTIYNTACMSYGGTADLEGALDLPFILVNYDGERFMSETMGYKWVGYHTNNQPFHMNHIVFDSGEACSAWYDICVELLGAENIRCYEAQTLDELAAMMQVDAGALASTVERYNGFVDAGEDADFGRMMRGASRIEQPPFRAIRMRPRHYTTYGGVAIDPEARVIREDGSAIEGLYAAGTVCGAIVEQEGLYYQGGVGQTLTFGYIAAGTALA